MDTLKKRLQNEIDKLQCNIEKWKAKLEADYTYNFEWGYSGDVYIASYKLKQLKGFFLFIENQPERAEEWLKHNIESIKKELLRGGYYGTSTSVFSNIAQLYRKEVSAELHEMYSYYLDWINDPKISLKII